MEASGAGHRAGDASGVGVGMWRRKQREQDLEREIRADMALEEEEQRDAGVPSDEAPYAARRAFGNVTLI